MTPFSAEERADQAPRADSPSPAVPCARTPHGRASTRGAATLAARMLLAAGCGWSFSRHRCIVTSCARVEPCRGRFAEGMFRRPNEAAS